MNRVLRITAIGVAVVSLLSLIVANAATATSLQDALIEAAWPLPNIVVGLLLTLKRPRLVIGWLFAAIGFLAGTGNVADVLATNGLAAADPTWWGVLGAWYGEWYWIPMIYATLVFEPLFFPSGLPQSRWWRRSAAVMFATLAAAVLIAMLQERLDTPDGLTVANPIGIPGLADVEEGVATAVFMPLTLIYVLAALTSLVLRYRGSHGVERQQLKWFTSSAAALIFGFILMALIDALFKTRATFLEIILFALTPLGAAVAILRYRLYAIDRIISRTVTYALVTALLIGVYVGAVTLMSAAIDPLAGESALAVAVATLAAAAAFRPAQRRVQAAVDRRFNRARYDVQRTVDGFRERVRSDVDLDRLCADLVAVTDHALQPAAAVVWLRAEDAAP